MVDANFDLIGPKHPCMTDESLEIILALLRQLEATLLGLKQLRGYVGQGVGKDVLAELIEEGDHSQALVLEIP